MNTAKYTARPWSCKDFDEEECRQQVLQSLKEHYNTAYSCAFLPPGVTGSQDGLLIAGYHSGDIRLFNWRRVCSVWLSSRSQQHSAEYSWHGHNGPVYAVALVRTADHGLLLATAGDDGLVKVWRASDIIAAAAAAQGPTGSSSTAVTVPPPAAAAVQLPHVQNPLGMSDGRQPAAQALAVDQQRQHLYVGASDGGVHVVNVQQLLLQNAAGQQQQQHQPESLVSLSGHAAAVLGLDYCSATHQLASASEDGTVRIWDCQSLSCLTVFNPLDETIIIPEGNQVELMRCIRSPPVTCIKFDACGKWLVVGTGQTTLSSSSSGGSSSNGGMLTLWNCSLNAAAKHKPTGKCIPQVLALTPSMVFMAGTTKQVVQFSFQLEEQRTLDVGAESVFGIDIDAGSGMMAVCGSKASVDLLSAQGATLGIVRPAPSVLTS